MIFFGVNHTTSKVCTSTFRACFYSAIKYCNFTRRLDFFQLKMMFLLCDTSAMRIIVAIKCFRVVVLVTCLCKTLLTWCYFGWFQWQRILVVEFCVNNKSGLDSPRLARAFEPCKFSAQMSYPDVLLLKIETPAAFSFFFDFLQHSVCIPKSHKLKIHFFFQVFRGKYF